MLTLDQSQTPRKVNPIVGMLLFLLSVALALITFPFGKLFGVVYQLYKKGITGVGDYYLELATIVDQMGNVLMQHLLNALWLKGEGKYLFGDRDETISSVLGKNQKADSLNAFGRWIANVLDRIDKNHSMNSIDYFVNRPPSIYTEEDLRDLKVRLTQKFPNVDFEKIAFRSS